MTGKQKRYLNNALIYLVLTVIFIFAIFPVIYTFMGSFKSNQELLTSGNSLFPKQFVWDNYVQAWNLANFERYTFNSVFMAVFIVLGTIITCTTAGYVFERGEFKLKNFFFLLVVSSMFVSLGSLTLYPTLMIA